LNPPIDCAFLRQRRLVGSFLLVDAASGVAVEAIRAVLMTHGMLLGGVSICRRDDGGEREQGD